MLQNEKNKAIAIIISDSMVFFCAKKQALVNITGIFF